mgnify:CR=1 FL=1
MAEKTCGFTGHRDIPDSEIESVKHGLRKEFNKAIADGYTSFLSGFAEGADLLFAEIVAEKCRENPALHLEAVIPYRYLKLMKKEETRALLESCSHIEIISEQLIYSVYQKRNRYIVEHSDRVIAVYDGRDKGGTVATIRMVHAQRKELREVPVGTVRR